MLLQVHVAAVLNNNHAIAFCYYGTTLVWWLKIEALWIGLLRINKWHGMHYSCCCENIGAWLMNVWCWLRLDWHFLVCCCWESLNGQSGIELKYKCYWLGEGHFGLIYEKVKDVDLIDNGLILNSGRKRGDIICLEWFWGMVAWNYMLRQRWCMVATSS